MNIDIQCCALAATDAPADHAERRLRFVMTRHSDRIQRIVINLGDIAGSFARSGSYCRIRVDLVDAPPVVSYDTGADIYALIDRSVDQAGRAVLKHLRRTGVLTARNGAGADARTPGAADRGPRVAPASATATLPSSP